MGNHWKDLIVWQKSHQLVKTVYKLLDTYPKIERFALIDQIRRASISIPTNIVEGHAKSSSNDFARYLYISRGSLEELRYLLLLSVELEYFAPETYKSIEEQCRDVSILLNNLIKSLKSLKPLKSL